MANYLRTGVSRSSRSSKGALDREERTLVTSLSSNFSAERINKVPVELRALLGPAYDGQPLPLAFVLDNVLTPEECENLIDVAEKDGFEPALVTVGESSYKINKPDFRNNYETRIHNQEFADALWDRILQFIPSTLQNRPVANLSLDLRFLRYDPGQKFGPHRDGTNRTRSKNGSWLGGNVSMITLQFYLNDGFEGGETSFLSWNTDERVDVVPKTGSVLAFEHSLLHQGSLLKSGRKYAFITDVMYREVELDNDETVETDTDGTEPGEGGFWKQNCSVM